MWLWVEEFSVSLHQNGTVRDLFHLLTEASFLGFPDLLPYRERLLSDSRFDRDKKLWLLSLKGSFSVKSFYTFLIDGGLLCPMSGWFWHSQCPWKIKLFN